MRAVFEYDVMILVPPPRLRDDEFAEFFTLVMVKTTSLFLLSHLLGLILALLIHNKKRDVTPDKMNDMSYKKVRAARKQKNRYSKSIV